ncbi:MAG: alginate lyase family protein [Phycisphaerales bacterium]
MSQLRAEADKALTAGPFTVTDKTFVPPSGDMHDFSTIGRYWWPNPDTPDGLPWVRRDGETNPQYFDPGFGDTQRFVDMWRATQMLARAYYLTAHEPYAEKAASLLRVWFIDPDTRMNPHARYAARFPGHWDGKSWGIHGTRQLVFIADAIGLLQGSPAWTAQDDSAMREWMDEYLNWLTTSENGTEERDTINNHAVAYDWLVIRLAVFVGRDDLALKVLEDFKTKRIAAQIEPDGSMPAELARATPWRYTGYSLEFLFAVAIQGDQLGVDLWHYRTDDGRCIRAALDYLVKGIQPEPGQIDEKTLQDTGVERIAPLLMIAEKIYDEPDYGELARRIGWANELELTRSGPNVYFLGRD